MRLFILPLTTRRAFIYCQRITQKPASELNYLEKATKKAAETWTKWESAEKGWQKILTQYGNRGLQRIPYQEWGLKSFPPLNQKIRAQELTDNKKFDVVYPGNIMLEEDVPKVMARLAKERKQLHWSRFTWSLVGLPFTIPFGLIPILPNIPFFYVAFRCWSHWRALKGSDHLDFIIDNRLFRTISSAKMEKIYATTAPDLQDSFVYVTRSQVEQGSDPEEHMLLTDSSHTLIAKSLGVPELSGEVERAVRQVLGSLKQEQDQEAEAEKSQIEAPRQQPEDKSQR